MQEIREWVPGKYLQAMTGKPWRIVHTSLRKRYFPLSVPLLLLPLPLLAYLIPGGSAELVLVLVLAVLLNCLFLTMLEFGVLLLIGNLGYTITFWWNPALTSGPGAVVGLWCFSVLLLAARHKIFQRLMILSETNRYLSGMARVDGLTGIYNRHYLFEAGRRIYHGFVRRGRPFCVVLLDIDDFQSINNNHGYDGGDLVLIWFSGLMNRVLRVQDVAGRYDGDEFLVIMPDTEREHAIQAGRRLRRDLVREKDKPESCRSMRFSMGLAQVRVSDRDFSDVVTRAVEALNDSRAGGNEKVHADQSQS